VTVLVLASVALTAPCAGLMLPIIAIPRPSTSSAGVVDWTLSFGGSFVLARLTSFPRIATTRAGPGASHRGSS